MNYKAEADKGGKWGIPVIGGVRVDEDANGAALLGEQDFGPTEDAAVAHHHHAALHAHVVPLPFTTSDQEMSSEPPACQGRNVRPGAYLKLGKVLNAAVVGVDLVVGHTHTHTTHDTRHTLPDQNKESTFRIGATRRGAGTVSAVTLPEGE